MKKILIAFVLLTGLFSTAQAQHVSVRLDFPGPAVARPAPPYRGAIWIGPEWRWQRNEYVVVPGYWAKPKKNRHWKQGHWKNGKRGYIWVPGRWR